MNKLEGNVWPLSDQFCSARMLSRTSLDVEDTPKSWRSYHSEDFGLAEPLLGDAEGIEPNETGLHRPSLLELWQELRGQAALALPQLLNMCTQYTVTLVCIASVGRIGELDLAAAAMSMSMWSVMGQSIIVSMLGGLDTQASQAFGAKRFDELGHIFQRTVAWLLLHSMPVSLTFLAVPLLLRSMGQDPRLCSKVAQYVVRLLPILFLNSIIRPINRILLAQRIAVPQATISVCALAAHIPITRFVTQRFGYVGAAYAYNITIGITLVFTGLFVFFAGLGPRVWGKPSSAAFKGWRTFGRLAYSSCAMRCMEAWAFGSMELWAGKLPDSSSAVAAVGVAFSVYGLLFMVYAALSMALCARVGNHLGANNAHKARTAVIAGAAAAPVLLLLTAAFLLEPHSQMYLLRAFTGGNATPQLQSRLKGLLRLMAIMQACDCVQYQMQGVVQGAGRQSKGVVINLVAYYICGLPAGVVMSYYLGFDVNGLVLGMIIGTFIQAVWYSAMVFRMDWQAEAEAAVKRVNAAAAARTAAAAADAEGQ